MRWQHVLAMVVLLSLVGCAAPAAPSGSERGAGESRAPAAPAAVADPTPWPATAPRTALRIALNAVSASMGPMWIAKDLGLFEQYGLDVELVTLQTSSQIAKVMAAGEIPIALSAAAGVVDAVLAGDDQILLTGYQNYMNFWVHSRPEVRSVTDLRGKRVGTTRIGSGAHLGTVEMLRRFGLEPDRDVAVLQLGGMPEVFGALSAGAVDAAILSIPWNFQAQDSGFPLLHDLSAQRIPYLQTGLATTRGYLQRNEDLVRRVLMAHLEGLARFHTDKATAIEVLARNLKSEDRELLERTYDVLTPLLERVPYPTPASIQTVIDQRAAENPAARQLTPAQVADDRLLRELDAAGFISRLYSSS
ncbi:MAG TPA: ABC transporter substrate-binding protein [Chloroflexota bacterium]|nr:ABC transporter substrate-binding protein [Chloroflexota bacterium]